MLIGLDGKRLEAALIDRAGPSGLVRGMPSLGVGNRDPAENFRKLTVMSGPQQQVPVIGHQAIGGDADARGGLGFGQNLFKGGVVSGSLKQGSRPTWRFRTW